MSEALTASPQKPSSNITARIGWGILIAITLYVCYFSHLGAIGFVGPDEPRYAWIARAMAETGDWVTPRLYGQPWFEKPPLYYWGAAVSFKLFGVSEMAARLPSAISALLATLALAWLALRMYGTETARWLLLLLPTTVGMIGFSHAAATDMPFGAMLTMAMVCAAVALRLLAWTEGEASPAPTSPSTPWAALLLFGFFLGLAVLAKGPAGIVLCGGAVFFWAVFTKRWRDAFRLLHPTAIAAFSITALPWYILCAQRNPDFFRVFIIEHNFKRYLTPEFQHLQPFWFYVPVVLVALLPWSISSSLFLGNAGHTLRSANWRYSSGTFFGCWGIFTIAFFSFSESKLPGYILPATFPFGMLLARSISLRVLNILPGDRSLRITSGLTLIALGILGVLETGRLPSEWLALAFVLGGFALVVLRDLRKALVVGVCAILIAVASALAGNMRVVLDQRYSARHAPQVARSVWNDYSPDRSSTYKLTRSYQYALNFYFHRELPEWAPDETTRTWVFAPAGDESRLRSLGLSCPLNALRYAVIVCEDPGLPIRRTSSRQLQ